MLNEVGDSNTQLLVKTVQCTAFRNLLEVMKDILTDCNLVFEPTGMKCLTMDTSQNVIVSVKLNANSFEEYYCKNRMLVGINVSNLFRLIKSIGSNDTLTLKNLTTDSNRLIIKTKNAEKSQCTTYHLNMLDIDEVRLDIPDTQFDSVLTMPSADFQRICRDMAAISETMSIYTDDNKLLLSARGDYAEQITEIGEREHGMFFTNKANKVGLVKYGDFSLKFLSMFSKASVMCGTVDLYLTPKYPLIMSYSVASLGRLLFVLASRPDSESD